MNELVCIVGPTGTGKTSYALKLAKKQPSILVSADSRQVYTGMDIVTGKDHPKDITIYGIDLVDPNVSCSVSMWYSSVMPHIKEAWKKGKLPIVVGGTGLYVKAITDGIATIEVGIDENLRKSLGQLSLIEVQQKLIQIDPSKFEMMNDSDRQNSRRLIRAIEIAQYGTPKNGYEKPHSKIIGINPPAPDKYQENIRDRVMSRLVEGAISETEILLKKYGKNVQSMSAIGYKSVIDFLEGKISKEEMIENWVDGEFKYAKRQMTWFRKQDVIWYDVGKVEE